MEEAFAKITEFLNSFLKFIEEFTAAIYGVIKNITETVEK